MSRNATKPQLRQRVADLKRRLKLARKALTAAKDYVTTVHGKVWGPEHKSSTLEDIEKGIEATIERRPTKISE